MALALGCGENNSSNYYSYQPSTRPEANPEPEQTYLPTVASTPVSFADGRSAPDVMQSKAVVEPLVQPEPKYTTLAATNLQNMADEGDAQACWMLGLRFDLGQGVATNTVAAFQWVSLAAARSGGVHRSLMLKDRDRLAAKLTAPQVEQASKPAKEFLEKLIREQTSAADQGNRSAQFALGMRLFHGEGIGADKKKAAEWLEKAAEQGHVGAAALLGRMYLNGDTLAKDTVKGYRLLERAAANGSILAWSDLAGAPKTMTPAQLAEASKAAAKLLEKKVTLLVAVADKGDAALQFKLGLMFYLGTEIPKDLAAAAGWFEKAGKQGHAEAPALLAGMHFSGEGVKKSFVETYKWHGIAKAHGNPTAAANQTEVAKLLTAGEKTTADKDVTVWLAANPKRK
jgi:TPR repeat protein